ncbi:MAG TPA: sigma-70 family RNA polymerase sigma factor [Chryseolinea sp.]|nr:sigma-70 family RNA polymerase sigma factor [Chryseolinea sp.]
MEHSDLLPNLFRSEYRNIVSVLSYSFGIKHVEIAEDIVSDTFLSATEDWSMGDIPDNPRAWLYAVARNKIKNYLRRHALFEKTISREITGATETTEELELDFSVKNIADSQLAMIFAICNPTNSSEAQIALALNLLCGFGVQEIADAFLTNKEVVYKRINRAKEKLRQDEVAIRQPLPAEIPERLSNVLMTLYLLFSEGYYSMSQNTTLRRDFCDEAMRLNMLLIDNKLTDTPATKALYALMCFHASRFDARQNEQGDSILYEDQDDARWDQSLITKGSYFLNFASVGEEVSRFHLEAGIAYWHTHKEDTTEKWSKILGLYNHLLTLEYSPVAALNRTFALSKTRGKQIAIVEAEKLKLEDNPHYFSLLGHLYTGIDNIRARTHFETALTLVSSSANRTTILRNIEKLAASC